MSSDFLERREAWRRRIHNLGLTKPLLGRRCARAFDEAFGKGWTAETIATKTEVELLALPNYSKQCLDYTKQWLAQNGLRLQPSLEKLPALQARAERLRAELAKVEAEIKALSAVS